MLGVFVCGEVDFPRVEDVDVDESPPIVDFGLETHGIISLSAMGCNKALQGCDLSGS